MDIQKLKELVESDSYQNSVNRNLLTDSVFKVSRKDGDGGDRKVDVGFEGLDDLSKIILRHSVIQVLGGYYENRELRGTQYDVQALRNFLNSLLSFIKLNNIVDIRSVTSGFLYEWLSSLVKAEDLPSYKTVRSLATTLNKFIDNSRLGHSVFPVNERIDSRKLEELLINQIRLVRPKINIYEWLEGGTFDTASLETALVMLNYSLQELNSPRFHVLKAWFETVRNFSAHREACFGLYTIHISNKREAFTNPPCASTRFFFENKCIPAFEDLHFSARAEGKRGINHNTIDFLKQWYELAATFSNEINSEEKFHSVVNGWTSGVIGDLSKYFIKCSMTIISILNGYRVSELQSLKATPIDRKSGILYLTSNIQKTHMGLPVKRSTSDAVAIAVGACLDLSFIDKTQPINVEGKEIHLSLFAETSNYSLIVNYEHYLKRVTMQNSKLVFRTIEKPATVNRWIKDVYSSALAELPEELTKEFDDLDEVITAHAFRHTFVDFLLRRFDGDVIPAIRHCFAHSSSDPLNYVINYLRTKVTPSVQKTAERAYTHELIMRIAGDHSSSQFSGHAVEYIRRELDKFQYASIEELDEMVHEWVFNDTVRLVPHSYGYCILFKERQNLARCKDTKLDVRNSENGESKLCIGCPNLAVHIQSHFEVLEQLRNVHLALIEDSKNPNNILSFFRKAKESEIQLSDKKVRVINDLLHSAEV